MIDAMRRQSQTLLLSALASTWAGAEELPDRRFGLEAGMGLLSHDGFLQTPAGGEPGTATAGRPTVDELAVGDGSYRWVAGTVGFGRYALDLRYTTIGDSGHATLDTALVSQGNAFDAGSAVRTTLGLDGLSLAFTRSFAFGEGTRLKVGPWIGWTAFDLDVDGAGAGVDRSYRVYALGANAVLDKALGGRWRVATEAIVAPAFEGAAARYSVEPSLSYGLTGRLEIRLATRLAAFRYDDAHKQVWPNRLRIDRQVMPTVSVRWLH